LHKLRAIELDSFKRLISLDDNSQALVPAINITQYLFLD